MNDTERRNSFFWVVSLICLAVGFGLGLWTGYGAKRGEDAQSSYIVAHRCSFASHTYIASEMVVVGGEEEKSPATSWDVFTCPNGQQVTIVQDPAVAQ